MVKKSIRKIGAIYSTGDYFEKDYSGSMIIIVCFIAGALIGSFLGSFSSSLELPELVTGLVERSAESPGFLLSLWNNSKYCLLVLALATSLLGVALVPLLAAFRGYLLSCAAASVITAYPDGGFALAAVILGLPALFSVPCFMLLSQDALGASKRLWILSSGRTKDSQANAALGHIIVCVLLLAISALAEEYISPALVAAILR